MSWIDNLKNKLDKIAIDKLPDSELQANTLSDPNQEQQDVPALPIDSDKPLVWDNNYVVDANGVKFLVELNPSIVGESDAAQVAGMSEGNTEQTNPNQNPALLDEWLKSSNVPEKDYSHNEQGTIDPISKEEEQNPSIAVHKQASINLRAEDYQESAGQSSVPAEPGASRSNPYPPCKWCSNYIAENATCAQGIDVEKVQAAKSCSWLNANSSPFGKPVDPQTGHKDKEIFNSDPADSGNGSGGANEMQQNIQNRANLREYFKKHLG